MACLVLQPFFVLQAHAGAAGNAVAAAVLPNASA
jgi:hypothetical protein